MKMTIIRPEKKLKPMQRLEHLEEVEALRAENDKLRTENDELKINNIALGKKLVCALEKTEQAMEKTNQAMKKTEHVLNMASDSLVLAETSKQNFNVLSSEYSKVKDVIARQYEMEARLDTLDKELVKARVENERLRQAAVPK